MNCIKELKGFSQAWKPALGLSTKVAENMKFED